MGVLGAGLLGLGLGYLGSGLAHGPVPAGYGGFSGYGGYPPAPVPYGFGQGLGYGYPGAILGSYSGIGPNLSGTFQSYPNVGGYGTWSPAEYGIPR
ncbi:spore coat protein [Bacillus sp. S3]|uniref:spore coat protein n=1 Tax=Bacillus sp. S3 TaxID=486398 RepID=UPI001188DC90|nr:spore coat protein [Bacillus sp. S3]QCJ44191.1 spore coat protein [Bacillus sp. S3]